MGKIIWQLDCFFLIKNLADGFSSRTCYWLRLFFLFEYAKHDNLSLNAGLDLRTYKGTHFREVVDFMGLSSWTETRDLKGDNDLGSGTIASNTVTKSASAKPWPSTFKTVSENQRIDYVHCQFTYAHHEP